MRRSGWGRGGAGGAGGASVFEASWRKVGKSTNSTSIERVQQSEENTNRMRVEFTAGGAPLPVFFLQAEDAVWMSVCVCVRAR